MNRFNDKRRALRHDRELVVRYRSAGALLTDWAVNISRGGMFINTKKPLPVGAKVILKIQLDRELEVAIDGQVAWVSKYANVSNLVPGMGVRFLAPSSAKERRTLARFVAGVRAAARG